MMFPNRTAALSPRQGNWVKARGGMHSRTIAQLRGMWKAGKVCGMTTFPRATPEPLVSLSTDVRVGATSQTFSNPTAFLPVQPGYGTNVTRLPQRVIAPERKMKRTPLSPTSSNGRRIGAVFLAAALLVGSFAGTAGRRGRTGTDRYGHTGTHPDRCSGPASPAPDGAVAEDGRRRLRHRRPAGGPRRQAAVDSHSAIEPGTGSVIRGRQGRDGEGSRTRRRGDGPTLCPRAPAGKAAGRPGADHRGHLDADLRGPGPGRQRPPAERQLAGSNGTAGPALPMSKPAKATTTPTPSSAPSTRDPAASE